MKIFICRANARELKCYDFKNLSKPLGILNVGTSPSVVEPYYDKDTGLIALVGRVSSFSFNLRAIRIFPSMK